MHLLAVLYGMIWYRVQQYGTVDQEGPSNGALLCNVVVWMDMVCYGSVAWYGKVWYGKTKMDPQMELYCELSWYVWYIMLWLYCMVRQNMVE